MKFIVLVAVLACALATDHVFKLGSSDSAASNTNSNTNTQAAAAPAAKPSAAPQDDGVKFVEAKVGDVLVFDLPQPKPDGENAGTMEWVFLEGMMGRQGDTWQVVSENMKVNDDGSRTFSFGFKITKAGEDVLSFINGDVSKVDDAIANFKRNPDKTFSVADMKGKSYAQVRIKAQ